VRKLGAATAGPTTASGGAMGGGGCCHGESDSVGVLEGGGEQGIGFAWLARLPTAVGPQLPPPQAQFLLWAVG